jgi:hypothetical protein
LSEPGFAGLKDDGIGFPGILGILSRQLNPKKSDFKNKKPRITQGFLYGKGIGLIVGLVPF